MDVSYNLFNKDNIIRGRTVTTDGKEIEDDIYWLSDDLIPTEQGDVFSFSGTEAYRIITYRENGEFNSRTGTIGGKYTNNSSVVAFFRVSGRTDPNDVMVNRGRTLLPYEPYGTWLNSDFLNIDKLKFNAEDLKDDLLNELMGYVDVKNPYPPALHLEEIYQGSKHPLWLSEDGEIIYGRNGSTRLIMSTDEWENTSEILTAPQHINMVRELGDGELIFSCNRKDTESIHAKVYKTIGFDRNNPENTEFRQVLRSGSPLANINNSWGIDIYDNIVLLLEYGRQGVDGSNYAYLSTDFGEKFIEIFELKTAEADGRPPHDEDGHVHTIAYDPYFNRIWLAVGDSANTATYYSDNMGDDWHFVEGSNDVQYTGIIALEDSVIFCSDRNPIVLHIFRRKEKFTLPTINVNYTS